MKKQQSARAKKTLKNLLLTVGRLAQCGLLTINLNRNGSNKKRFGILPQKCGGRLFDNTDKCAKVYFGDGSSIAPTACYKFGLHLQKCRN